MKYEIIATRTNLDGYPEEYIVSWNNAPTSDFDSVMLFDTRKEAENWLKSDEPKEWYKDYSFKIIEIED